MSIKSLIVEKLVKKTLSSWTAGVGLTVGAAGVAATIDPKLLEMIPEQYRGLAVLLVSLATIVARLRREIVEVVKAVKNG